MIRRSGSLFLFKCGIDGFELGVGDNKLFIKVVVDEPDELDESERYEFELMRGDLFVFSIIDGTDANEWPLARLVDDSGEERR